MKAWLTEQLGRLGDAWAVFWESGAAFTVFWFGVIVYLTVTA